MEKRSAKQEEGTVTGGLVAARERYESQRLPVRLYESDGLIMVAAPMPGLEPQDISVKVSGQRVAIHGNLRGPHQDERYLHTAEWQIGPYHREVALPRSVDPARTNATYGNGVLVLACPKAPADADQAAGELDLELTTVEATRGLHVGHAGRDMHVAGTEEHLARMEATARRAAEAPVRSTAA